MKKITSQLFFALLCVALQSQIIVNPNNNGNQLAQILAGNGVTISNVNINCPGTSSGTFNCPNCNLGMSSGIALTSGDINLIPGPNNLAGSGVDNLAPGDAQLTALAGGFFASTYDACVLEFDMQVLSDSVEFRYSFGSEEYLEWVSAGYNDVFAFYISGPGIPGQQNIALVPGTATAVSIDNVNNVSNSMYYVNNGTGTTAPQNGSNYYLQYDGFTTVLTAKRKNLQPCQTYHLRLAIADAGDGILDSGVFLEANSLTSNGVTVDDPTTSDPNSSNAMEGCVTGNIVFHLQNPVPAPVTVTYQIGGTATNGVDYQSIPNSIVIPAGDTSVTLTINSIVDNITEGTETVAIYLLNQCNNQPYDSAVMQIYDPFPVRTISDTTICNGDQVTLTSQGLGVFSWTPSGSLSSPSALSPVASPSSTTTYTLTGNIGTCVSRDTVTVNVISAPFTVSAGNDVLSCTGGPVPLSATVTGQPVNGQPFQYLWSPASTLSSTNTSSTTATPSGSQSYVVQVNSGNCRVSDTVNVTLGQLSVSATATPETCSGYGNGSASVTVSAGSTPFTYQWNNGAATASINNITGGTYTVTVYDASQCSATANAIVTSNTSVLFNNPSITDVSCSGGNNGAVTLTASGGNGNINYLWSNGSSSSSIGSLNAGLYTLTATDASGCSASTSVTVSEPPVLNVSVQFNNVSCNGSNNGSINLTGFGGTSPYSYLWNDGSIGEDKLSVGPGAYSVTITDFNACSMNMSFNVTEPNVMVASTTLTDVACFGSGTGAVDLSISGGTFPYSYIWSNGSTTQDISQLNAGNYQVTATDANSCTIVSAVSITQPAVLNISLTKTDLDCFNDNTGAVSCSVSGGVAGYNYLWSNNFTTTNISNLSAGVYSVTVTDTNLCQASASETVNEPAQLVLNTTKSDPVCYGDANGVITAIVSGGSPGYTYLWNNAGTTAVITNLPIGNYSLTVTDSRSCSASANETLTEPAPLSAVLASIPPLCVGGNDGSINTTMVGGGVSPFDYTLQFSGNSVQNNNSGAFNGLSSGQYTVTVSDANNCTTSSTVTVLSPYPDEVQIVTTPTSCYGNDYTDGTLEVIPVSVINQPYTFSLDGGAIQNSGIFTGLSAGLHSLSIFNKNGCLTDTVAMVSQPAQGILHIYGGDTTITLGDNVTLNTFLDNFSPSDITDYQWLPDVGLSCSDCEMPVFSGYTTTTYTLLVTYSNGCKAEAVSTINIEGYPPVFIPNSFTPNGDGNNDVFYVYGRDIKNIGIKLFDRWGEKVFESLSQFEGWDGSFSGRVASEGVYVYAAEITYLDGKKTQMKGSVTLIR